MHKVSCHPIWCRGLHNLVCDCMNQSCQEIGAVSLFWTHCGIYIYMVVFVWLVDDLCGQFIKGLLWHVLLPWHILDALPACFVTMACFVTRWWQICLNSQRFTCCAFCHPSPATLLSVFSSLDPSVSVCVWVHTYVCFCVYYICARVCVRVCMHACVLHSVISVSFCVKLKFCIALSRLQNYCCL